MANLQYSIATTIQSTLQNSVTLTSSDDEVSAIASAAVVVRKMALREREYEVGHDTEAKPGILIVPTKWRSPPEAGNDQKDDVFYDYDVVIIASDVGWNRVEGLNTYCQWQQNIRHYFNEAHTRVTWPTGNGGIVLNSWATTSEGLNDWRWVQQGEAAIGVRVMVLVREDRG